MISDALPSLTWASGRRRPLSFVGHFLLTCNEPRRGRIRSRGNRNLHAKWKLVPAALSVSAENSAAPTASAVQFAPSPFLNNAAPSRARSTAAVANSAVGEEERALPLDAEDDLGRHSKFLVKDEKGVDGTGWRDESERKESIAWVDALGEDACLAFQNGSAPTSASSPPSSPSAPRPFSLLSWNILAQSLYESQYQRRRIQRVALSSDAHQLPSLSSSPHPHHPHPWPRRVKRIVETLSHYDADVVCLQECEIRSFRRDLAPAMSRLGYDGVAQEDDRPDRPTAVKEATKHRYPRNHIVATFWKRDKFEPAGEASVRTRSMTTVLRLRLGGDDDDPEDGAEKSKKSTPTVAVINVHLEGHPRRFSERTHQLQHAMADLARTVERERGGDPPPTRDGPTGDGAARVGRLNALVLAGDFNCELQSSACSAYLRMGRLGRRAGLGGVHGEDSLVLPPSLLETAEAAEVLSPITEWGRALPEDEVADVGPHPFRRGNAMTSAYPAWLGRDDAREHFTFCSELSKTPVAGLDQLWFSGATLDRKGLMRNFVDDSGLWERYFYDEAEAERMRGEERGRVLASGLPSPDCRYPSDHLPVGAIFDWRWDECEDPRPPGNDAEEVGNARNYCARGVEVRGLNIVGSEGSNLQDDVLQDQLNREKRRNREERGVRRSFDTPREELDHLLRDCPYDSDEQQSDVQFVLSPIEPPLCLVTKERPTPDQMEQLGARRDGKAKLAATASTGVRLWLKDIWKASKRVGKWERRNAVEEARLTGKGEH